MRYRTFGEVTILARLLVAAVLVVVPSCGGSVRDVPLPAEASLGAGEAMAEAGDSWLDGAEPSVDVGEPSANDGGPPFSEADATSDARTDAANIYVPVGAPVSFDPEDLPGGSFEGSQGHGFDTCYSRTPGDVGSATQPAASEGTTFLRFTSWACAASPLCRGTGSSEAQLFLWGPPEPSHDTARGLYFDMINLGSSVEGSLSFYSVDSSCEGAMPVVDVPLADLALDGSWRTRCVPLAGPLEGLGIAITGTAYDVGLDAVRFGGPCR